MGKGTPTSSSSCPQTALPISGQPVIPPRLSGHHLRPAQPHRRHLIGCDGGVQQRTNRRLRPVPPAPRNQRGAASRLIGGLQQAAQEPSGQLRRPLEATVRTAPGQRANGDRLLLTACSLLIVVRKTKTTEIPPPEKVDVQTPDAPFL